MEEKKAKQTCESIFMVLPPIIVRVASRQEKCGVQLFVQPQKQKTGLGG